MSRQQKTAPFHPVILGSDLGTYALARSFYEGWGKVSTVVTAQILGPIQNSVILDAVVVPGNPDDDTQDKAVLIEGLLKLGPQLKEEHPDEQLLLMANIDSNIWDIMKNADKLREYYTFAFPDLSIIEQTNDKALFPKMAAKHGMSVPPTIEVDLSNGIEAAQQLLADYDQPLPWILKPAVSYGYERLHWPGKAKVYTINSRDDIDPLLSELHQHTCGHPRAQRFVVQPRVDGNDTYNLSITAYVDSRSKVTMLGSAQVLLEDHSPTALGNPAAMITEPYPQLYKQAKSFLEGIGWHGFANFDIKVDKNSGKEYFFEVNPRIGRNSYYNTASGLNPLEFLVADLIDNEEHDLVTLKKSIYYSVLPKHLVLRYVDDRLGTKVKRLYRAGRAVDPMFSPGERTLSLRSLKRATYAFLSRKKHWLKFHRNYPKAAFEKHGVESFDSSHLTGK